MNLWPFFINVALPALCIAIVAACVLAVIRWIIEESA